MAVYVLMTALPPTTGHIDLIDFASLLNRGQVHVILCTQPSEPFHDERFWALRDATSQWHNVKVHKFHKEIPQDATAPGFWDMWAGILLGYGMTKNDTVVASEPYGQKVADLFGAKFIPFDPKRELNPVKATEVRLHPAAHFDKIIPEFQPYLRKTVTFFGAESVGKTTMSKAVAQICMGHWRFEYARPYLEMVGAEVNDEKMFDIFQGQRIIQQQTRTLVDKPFVIQDTDLWSTIGYWEFWKGERAPEDWYWTARSLKSDLYIILTQNIPFEEDQLRYGGDKRESADQFWIDLCEREGLNYIVIDEDGDWTKRIAKASDATFRLFLDNAKELREYQRAHND